MEKRFDNILYLRRYAMDNYFYPVTNFVGENLTNYAVSNNYTFVKNATFDVFKRGGNWFAKYKNKKGDDVILNDVVLWKHCIFNNSRELEKFLKIHRKDFAGNYIIVENGKFKITTEKTDICDRISESDDSSSEESVVDYVESPDYGKF